MWMVGWAVIFAELLGAAWLVWLYSQGHIVIAFEKGADIATLVLTAAALVVTGVAVGVAVVTVWGFREIRDRAVKQAVREALKAVAGNSRGAFEAGAGTPDADDADKIAKASE
jgi:hypothetical protein